MSDELVSLIGYEILTHIWHANPDDGDVRCSRCDTAPWMRAAERRCGEVPRS